MWKFYWSKNSKVRYICLSTIPCFLRYCISNISCWRSIENIRCCQNYFIPIFIWKLLLTRHTSGHIHDRLIFPLCYSIMLWMISCRILMIPFCWQKVLKLLDLYSPPLSNLSTFKGFPLYLFASTLNSLNLEKVSNLFLRKYTHIFLL